jgi:hypothetical protein
MEHDLKIRPTGKFGPRGERYEVLIDGEIIASGFAPEFAACRAMQERGALGHIRLWRKGKSTWDLRLSIEAGSKCAVMENSKAGPRLTKWSPFEKPTEWIEATA